jgi:putative ABC transport system permease protein
MKFFDLLALVLDNLGRRKARVALTAVGVIIGTAAVVVLVSLANGLQQNANSQLGNIGDLTIVNVFPGFNGGEGGSPVVMSAVGGGKEGIPQQTIIDETKLEAIRAMPGVETVITRDSLQAGARLILGQLEGGGQIVGLTEDGVGILGLKVA